MEDVPHRTRAHRGVPFFIEGDKESVHPSVDVPGGCTLTSFAAASPEPDELRRRYQQLGLDMMVTKADKPQLLATVRGSKGTLRLAS